MHAKHYEFHLHSCMPGCMADAPLLPALCSRACGRGLAPPSLFCQTLDLPAPAWDAQIQAL